MQAERGRIGIVAIGRNEGERLRRCLESLVPMSATIVYVDSGSTDGSRRLARAHGAHVVELDTSVPFTAARARNAGFERLCAIAPDVEFVQFVDGDCSLHDRWLEVARSAMGRDPDVAVVCGRRRERHPESSVYNRLCDVEWDTPIGPARACGGDAFVRVRAFREVGGFDPRMIAGEEPDLCFRLLRQGQRVVRLDSEMTLHDAAMTSWTQWWQRAVRTGHTTAEMLAKHGPAAEHKRLRRAVSATAWAVALPLGAALVGGWALARGELAVAVGLVALTALAYTTQLARIRARLRASGRSAEDARAWARSCTLAKWPETWGMLLFAARRALRRPARWIEYKPVPRAVPEREPELAQEPEPEREAAGRAPDEPVADEVALRRAGSLLERREPRRA